MPRLTQDELVPVFAAARQAGARTVLDVVTPGPANYLPRLDRLLPHVDVFMPNDHESELMTGERDPVRQAEHFRRLGAHTVIITSGIEGAVLVGPTMQLRSGAFATPLVDGSGAGDA